MFSSFSNTLLKRFSTAALIFVLVFGFNFITSPSLSLAQPPVDPGSGSESGPPVDPDGGGGAGTLDPKFPNPLNVGTIDELVELIINAVITLAVPVSVLFIIYAGFLFVTARGDVGQINKAKEILLYTIIGVAVILGSKVIFEIIQTTINSVST